MTGRPPFPPYEPPAEPEPEPPAPQERGSGRPTFAPYVPPGQGRSERQPQSRPRRPPRPATPRRPPRQRTSRRSPRRSGLLFGAMLVFVAGRAVVGAFDGPDTSVPTPSGVIRVHDAAVKKQLEDLRDRYVTARREGRLASVGLRDGDAFDDTAVLAFAYLLTDRIVAAGFGVDHDTAVGYARDAAALERRLLAHEPLGEDIEITFAADRVFRYDGDTGKGGYVDPTDGASG